MSNRAHPFGAHIYMDTMENKIAAKVQFWMGAIMGAMAGVLIAAYTDPFADRLPNGPKERKEKKRPSLAPPEIDPQSARNAA